MEICAQFVILSASQATLLPCAYMHVAVITNFFPFHSDMNAGIALLILTILSA